MLNITISNKEAESKLFQVHPLSRGWYDITAFSKKIKYIFFPGYKLGKIYADKDSKNNIDNNWSILTRILRIAILGTDNQSNTKNNLIRPPFLKQYDYNSIYKGESFSEDSVEYRTDGSIIYNAEAMAYIRIVNMTLLTGNEEAVAILEDKMLVLPSYANDSCTAKWYPYGYNFTNKGFTNYFVDALSKTEYKLIATAHNHPGVDSDMTGDRPFARIATPFIPMFALYTHESENGKIEYLISSKDKSQLRFASLRKSSISLGAIMEGKESLRIFSKKVVKFHTKSGQFEVYPK